MKRKALALVLSFAMLTTVCVPGTVATETDTQPVLVCEKTEHSHIAECYTQAAEPQCGLEESSGHTHDDGCYTEHEVLTCNLPEDENHTHDESCYTTEKELICSQEEAAGHTHDDSCYGKSLTCGLEEHTHGPECYAPARDSGSSAEKGEQPASPVSPDADLPPIEQSGAEEEPICNCGSEDGNHAEDCPMYKEPENILDIPDEAVRIAKGDGIQNIEMNPGATVTFAFVGETPDFVLWKFGTSPWADLDITSDTYGDVAALEAVCDYTLPADAVPGEQYAIGVLWHNDDVADINDLFPTMVETVAVVTVAGETEVGEVSGETESGIAVTVGGELPKGAELALNDADVDTIPGFDNLLYGVGYSDTPYVAFDISLLQDGSEVQPESPVMVSVDASELGLEAGDKFVVYHVHEGNVEELGTYISDGRTADFEMSSFSYVIILNGKLKVSNVDTFYSTTVQSTNNHYHAIGVYFTSSGEAHLLLGGDQNLAGQLEIGEVTINGVSIPNVTYDFYGKNIQSLILQNGENETDRTDLLEPGYPHVLDFNLGNNLTLQEHFTVGIKWTAQGGHAVDGMEVTVVFDDGIQKTVDSINGEPNTLPLGQNPEVVSNDEVIYKIVVANGADSSFAISGDVIDILPADIFDWNTVQYSPTGADGSWVPATVDGNGKFTVASTITVGIGTSEDYYVKATVVNPVEVGSYQNAARFVKSDGSYRESVATVEVVTPPCGDLSITKNVLQDYENDVLPDDTFVFTVNLPGEDTTKEYSYTITGGDMEQTSGIIVDGGSIHLKQGQTAVIEGVPVGTVVVNELGVLVDNSPNNDSLTSNYRTYVGSDVTEDTTGACVYSGSSTISAGGSAEVIFTNIYKRHLADLTIHKSGWETIDENQTFIFRVQGEGIDLRVVIQGNNSKTIKDLPIGNYTVTEETKWSWRYTPDGTSKSVNLTASGAEVAFSNTRSLWKWLNGAAHEVNKFLGLDN